MDRKQLDSVFFSIQKALRSSLSRIASSSQDIDNIVQETYLRAVANRTSTSINDPEGYLFRTSRNIALNEKARLYRQLEVSLPVEEVDQLTVLMDDKPVERDIARKQQFAEFCLAVSDLPIKCRRVFILRKVYGYSQAEIAQELGISKSTVETHITKGMQRMRRSITQRASMSCASSNRGGNEKAE